jgi:hypothetical protein
MTLDRKRERILDDYSNGVEVLIGSGPLNVHIL